MGADHGCLQLSGNYSVSVDATSLLAAQTRITELEMHGRLPWPHVPRELVSFGSLHSLAISSGLIRTQAL